MKKKLFLIHQYVGLIVGGLMFLTAISGALYVFHDELFQVFHHDVMYVQKSGSTTLPVDHLIGIANRQLPNDMKVTTSKMLHNPMRAWEFRSYHQDQDAVTYFGWIKQDKIVYINPYTGKVLGVLNHKYEFFQLVKMFHWSYLLRTEYGQPIVGGVTALFFLCLITGLWLWWPKNGVKRSSFKFRYRKSFKVLNRDIHFTLGALTFPLALILSITGMVWSYRWVMGLVYLIFNLGVHDYDASQVQSTPMATTTTTYEKIYRKTQTLYPSLYYISLSRPKTKKSPVQVFVKTSPSVYYNSASLSFDQFSGKLLREQSYDNASSGEKAIRMNYDIHVGAIGGILGKILMFLVSLILSSLPLTGYYLWSLKRRK
ncbi:PepSY domain-containing protein [Halosquirtibacter laminarini]|uniref:PepSY domain-containing protein n=1 Tax=Halosquirtibacter laminarini TaxID=3374600 RepID=A0AC61NPU3_9BACT|nr:PepSY domain-containing protein [Prolixibacteraceae bacterium]